jgi:hypothetical protein
MVDKKVPINLRVENKFSYNYLGSPVRSGFGGIIRNIFGHYLTGFSGFIPETSDILLAELYAI